MAHGEKLPWDLIDEILSRVPPTSLVRYRTACKRWNALFDNKLFIKNHKMTFRFILITKSKIYSVSIDPEIEVRELTLDMSGLESQIPKSLVDCDEFLLCNMDKGVAVWNPWLRQSRWIEQDLNQTRMESYGIGYNSKGSYKMVAAYCRKEDSTKALFTVHDFASEAWKDYESASGARTSFLHTKRGVSLNGNLYWITYSFRPTYGSEAEPHPSSNGEANKADPKYHLTKFNSSSEKMFRYCDLPCGTTDLRKDALVLRVFKGDRFSLLKQCHETKKIEIWVSKNKINNNDVNDGNAGWIKFMQVTSRPNLPDLVDTVLYSQPSYFIDEDKRLVVCSCDATGRAWIYVFEENKVISKTQISSVVDLWPSHCTFIPSLVPVPRGRREEQAE